VLAAAAGIVAAGWPGVKPGAVWRV